jgi:hypothetical protein
MKRWLGLFGILAVATVLAVLWTRYRGSERQHANFEKIAIRWKLKTCLASHQWSCSGRRTIGAGHIG